MTNTLVIKHLPWTFNEDEKVSLLKHFGAQDVKVLSSKRKKYSLAFAIFPSTTDAEIALKKLHQLEVSGSKLNVEFAKDRLPEVPSAANTNINYDNKSNLSEFISRLNAFNNSINFMQPPPPHLKYKYPGPNKATLSNIMHALATNSKFYTQVCHLMNRMNLPPPFSTVPDYFVDTYTDVPLDIPEQKETSEESELESDPDDHKNQELAIVAETKPKKKAVKRPVITKIPEYGTKAKQLKLSTEEVFDKVDLATKKIEVKVSSDALTKQNEDTLSMGTFGTVYSANIKEEPVNPDFISSKQLSDNRLSESNYSTLPAFKNYNPGPPSCRLYIKNLAKQVTLQDLHFIFKRYLIPDYNNGEDNLLAYDVKLMQEGRMKGQAFVTLQNEEQARRALKETNGYILKDKPMVVAFARSAK